MNQPRFKFGDKVLAAESHLFTVREITDWEDGFRYSAGYMCGPQFPENALKLYQEPKQTKLYAYINSYEARHFLGDHGPVINDDRDGSQWFRDSSLDLTFGEQT